MSGTFTPGTLADGQVASSVTALYTVPSDTAAFIQRVTFGNNSATSQTLLLYVCRSGGSNRLIRQFVLAQYETADWPDDAGAYNLAAGDALLATTTTADEVDFTVTGVTDT